MPNRLMFKYEDEDGELATHSHWVAESIHTPADAAIENLAQAVGAVSEAKLAKMVVLWDLPTANVAGTGPYDAEDKMVLKFRDTLGNITQIAIPAPTRDAMAPNDEEFVKGSVTMDEVVRTVLAYLVAKGAEALIEYIGSYRTRKN